MLIAVFATVGLGRWVTISRFTSSGEMPIEELMRMYGAAENESTDLQSDVESSQESSEEGK